METLLECGVPIDAVNEYSVTEKKPSRSPPHWEMVFWWTRKPLARAVVAASPLSAEAYQTPEQFLNYSENMYGEVRFLLVT